MNLRSKFIEGAAFGAGFALAFSVVAWVAFLVFASSHTANDGVTIYSTAPPSRSAHPQDEVAQPFHDLSLEEQIKKASFIALARFEPAPDGRRRAIVKEFLKETPGSTIHYKIGDELNFSSYYPQSGQERGDGVVVFFIGSPATMKSSSNFYGDRIATFGDIPLELFRRKCKGNA